MSSIDTEVVSKRLRDKAINLNEKSVSITNFLNSEQKKDIKENPNCEGFGRIRHFKYQNSANWPKNPLPILPAIKALNGNPSQEIKAQVFQNSICNWRCWYCFVDFKLLNGNPNHSSFKTCEELLDLLVKEPNYPKIIDLTGGQPDLTPEWVPWMMDALIDRGLENEFYLWSDDNLSNDYFWRYLSADQIQKIQKYEKYGRVCCFKGIDKNSFALNTKANPDLFDYQFDLVKRLIPLNLDLYFYITLTTSVETDLHQSVPKFFDKIQSIHKNLPLRIVPLEIKEFTPVLNRFNKTKSDLNLLKSHIESQNLAIELWGHEMTKRFSAEELLLPITNVKITV